MNRTVTAIAIALLSLTAFAASTSDIAVTSTISDYNPSGIAYYVQSDGQYGGAYYNGQAGVESILQSTAAYSWELSTYNSNWTASSGRNALITLGPSNQESATATLPSIWPSWGTHVEPVRFIEKCFELGVNMLAIKPGSPQACPIMLRLGPNLGRSNNVTYYRLSMAPVLCPKCKSYPETQDVQVSCNAQDASGNCSDWSFDSIPPTSQSGGVPTNQVIARLSQVTMGDAEVTNCGDFYLTFHIRVTNP